MAYASGVVTLIIAIITIGSYGVPYKLSHRKLSPQAFLLSMYVGPQQNTSKFSHALRSIGVALSSVLAAAILAPKHMQWNWAAVLCGVLLAAAWLGSIFSFKFVGIALGQSLTGGAAVLASALWGLLLFHDSNDLNIAVYCIGAATVSIGIVLFATLKRITCQTLTKTLHYDETKAELLSQTRLVTAESETLPDTHLQQQQRPSQLGIVCGLFAGCVGGSILVPLRSSGYDLAFRSFAGVLPAFSCGAVITAAALVTLQWMRSGEDAGIVWRERKEWKALILGAVSGCLWNAGNVCSAYAVQQLGYAIAYASLQAALLVSGLWGLCVFREATVNGRSQSAWWLSAAVTLTGVVLMVISRQE